jgi:hypothetical protein
MLSVFQATLSKGKLINDSYLAEWLNRMVLHICCTYWIKIDIWNCVSNLKTLRELQTKNLKQEVVRLWIQRGAHLCPRAKMCLAEAVREWGIQRENHRVWGFPTRWGPVSLPLAREHDFSGVQALGVGEKERYREERRVVKFFCNEIFKGLNVSF